MNYRKSLCILLGLDEAEEEEKAGKAGREAGDEDEDFYESISMFYDYAPSRFVLCFVPPPATSSALRADCPGFT